MRKRRVKEASQTKKMHEGGKEKIRGGGEGGGRKEVREAREMSLEDEEGRREGR